MSRNSTGVPGSTSEASRIASQFVSRMQPVVEFEIVDRAVSGDLAYDVGYYLIGRQGSDERSRGKFVVVWKRGADGTWRIHADGYSDVASG